jgi:hypothetical protein
VTQLAERDISALMTERELLAQARKAAKDFERPDEPLGWREAMAAAPWPKSAPPAWEDAFRRAFAQALVKRGIAREAARPGSTRDLSKPSQPTNLFRRLVSASEAEFAAQDRHIKAIGARSWSTWARRVLSEAASEKK